MNDHDRLQKLYAIRALTNEAIGLAEKKDRDGRNLFQRLSDSFLGWRSTGGYDQERTSGGATVLDDQGVPMPRLSDPTGEWGTEPDQARDDQRSIDHRLHSLERETMRLVDDFTRHALRPPNVIEQCKGDDEPGCESCARLPGARGGPRWEPVRQTAKVAEGKLVVTYKLCRWCADFVRSEGVLPTKGQLDAHHTGRKVRKTA